MKEIMTQAILSASPSPSTTDASTTAQVISLSELHPPFNEHTRAEKIESINIPEVNPLHHVKTALTVCVGSVTLTIGELLQARKDHVIRLDNAIHDPVDLLIEGRVVARGQLIAIGDHFGVRITQLPQVLEV
jgi:flagellar motor switch protein FliN